MIIYAIGAISIVFFNAVLWYLILQNRKRDRIVRAYLVWSACIACWSLGYAVTLSGLFSRDVTLLWNRSCHAFAVLIPVTFLHLAFAISKSRRLARNLFVSRVAGCLAAVLVLLVFTPLFVKDLWSMGIFKYQPLGGPVYVYFAIFFASLVAYGLLELVRAYWRAQGNEREQIKVFLLGSVIGYLGGANLFLQAFHLNINPTGVFAISSYVLFTGYAIYKYGFMDMEIIIKRATVFAGLFTFVYGVFMSLTLLSQEIFQKSLQWNQFYSMIPSVVIVTFTLRPIENILTNMTEKFLFQKKYDYRELLRTFTNEVLTILDLQKLTEQTIADLTKIIKLESSAILLLDYDTKSYKIAASVGVKDRELIFKVDDALIHYLKQSRQPLIKDKEAESMEGHSFLRDDFKKLNAQLCLPISHHDELLGVLCLGMKKSGEEFTPEDIDILMTLARTEGIAIANAQLFDQLSKTQAEAAQREKMAVIGTLAAGINHEICNPLGIVRGQCEMFLLNLRDGIYGDKSKEDLVKISTDIMNKVIRETDRATAITKRLSGFAKPAKKIDTEEVFVEKETDEVMGLVGHDLKLSNIEFKKQFDPGFPTILADRRQIQEVLFNIIRNAAQAMDKKDGQITLSGTTLNGMAVIKIADNGSGIPKDKIGQIFNPFFTTKEPGKGTGLGLFIVRQVVERNHGTISVDSQEGTGTTFTLTFPITPHIKAIAA